MSLKEYVPSMQHHDAVATLASERYLLDEMPEDERFEFEEHYFSCPVCAEDVRLGTTLKETVREAATERARDGAGRPAAASIAPPSPWWRSSLRASTLAPLAAAAVFAMVAVYQTLIVVPPLRRASGPQALVPVVLRAQTRGESPIVRIDGGSDWLPLAIESRDAAPGEMMAYQLKAESGGEVMSSRAAAPTPGNPLLLLIPAAKLTPGRYVLVVQPASAPASQAREYSFNVVRP